MLKRKETTFSYKNLLLKFLLLRKKNITGDANVRGVKQYVFKGYCTSFNQN